MYIVSVTPFSNSIKRGSLSYFSPRKITPGKIVTVPLRKKTIKGLVTKCEDSKKYKQELKKASYEIKKIRGTSRKPLFNKAFIESSKETAEYFATSTGSIIKSLVPKQILDDSTKFQYEKTNSSKKEIGEIKNNNEKYIIQTNDDERYSDYKSLVRSEFAQNKSVFFCVPTIEDAENSQILLSKGIEKNTFVFHSKIAKKQIEKKWQEAIQLDRPVLIIATAAFLCIPRHDFGVIVVERESSGAYITFKRPFFDIRKFAEIYAKNTGAALLLGDLLLRAETLWRYDQQEFIERTPIKFRSLNTASGKLIDMRNENKKITKSKIDYKIISDSLKNILKKAHTESRQTFLLTSRKGLYPVIVCGDCGQTLTCDECSSPLVLYSGSKNKGDDPTEKDNYFKCHQCAKTIPAGIKCENCGSWKLNMLGCGIDNVSEKIKEIVPEENIFVLDKDKASTSKKAREIVKNFQENPSGVLIGTEMALLYIKENIDNVGIVSIDSMFSIPDFQIRERILNILLRARALAIDNFLIQTRNPKNEIFNEAMKGNLADFYRNEFRDRKKFNYPPFSILIKISGGSTSEAKIKKDFEAMKNFFEPYELEVYKSLTHKIKNNYILKGLIRIPREKWVDPRLAEKLKQIPPQYKIEVDAKSII